MTRMVRLLGVGLVLVTSLATAVSARERGVLFWAAIVLGIAATIAIRRILREPKG